MELLTEFDAVVVEIESKRTAKYDAIGFDRGS